MVPPELGGFTDWLLPRLTQLPPEHRRAYALGLALLLAAIGWLDHSTGTRLSLVPLYLIPVSLAGPWFGRTGGIIAAFAAVAVRFIADASDLDATVGDTWLWWNSLAGLIVYVVVVWLLDALIRFSRQLEQRVQLRTTELEEETRKRQDVQRQLLELSASERSAMGRELHDQLGQHLVGTAMAAQVLAHRLQSRDEASGREARKIADLVEQGIAQTRHLAHGLMLTSIEPGRLGAEFQELCATLRQQYPRVACECVLDAPPVLVEPGAAAQVYRIGGEALRNALRHSGAKHVQLRLDRAGDQLQLRVEDDGSGIPADLAGKRGLGLSIMRHRAEHLGATLELISTPGQGTRITCLVPLGTLPRFTS